MFWKTFPTLLACLLLVLLAVGCGGGADNSDLRQTTSDDSPFNLVVEQIAGSVAESANTAVRHEVKTLKGDVVKVTILAEDAVQLTGAAVVLEYDETKLAPREVLSGDFLGSDPIFFNTMDFIGEVPVAISQYGTLSPVNGSGVLAELYFDKGTFDRSLSDTGGMPPRTAVSDLVADFDANLGEVALTWSEVNPGDCNQDSRVSGPDVLYLAAHMGQTATPGTPAFCCDTNGNGFVDTGDVIEIGVYYRSEIDGYIVQTSENYTMLGPWADLDRIDRPVMTEDDPSWASCLPEYGVDTEELLYIPPFFPFWYKVKAFYQDDVTQEEFAGPNSNYATSRNAIVMQTGRLVIDEVAYMDYHNGFGNSDQIWVEITAGVMEATTAMSFNINFNNEYLDLDTESIIYGDFFGSPNHSLFPPPEGSNDFDLVVWDSGEGASGTGVVCYLAFDVDVPDQESNIYFGIDPEQGTLFTNSDGEDTQFSSTGDTWAMWGGGSRPLHPPKPCFLFNDDFNTDYWLTGWEIGATGSDEDEDTGWYLDFNTFCSADASLHWYDPGTEPEDAYGDDNDDWIMTPSLDLTGYDPEDPEVAAISISGQAMWEMETGFPSPDYVNVEVATYPGYSDWAPIYQFSGVNVPDPDDPEDPDDDPPCPGWTTIDISLFDFYGERIKVRLKAHSDFSNAEPMFGFAIENFGVGIAGAGGGPGPGGAHAEILLIDASGSSTTDIPEWETVLEDLGYSEGTGADTWTNITSLGITSGSQLYDYDLLIWAGSTQYYTSGVNLSSNYTYLNDYLNNGGGANGPNLIVMQDDLIYDLAYYGGSTFLPTIGMSSTFNDSGAQQATSATGVDDTCFDGETFDWGYVYSSFPDTFSSAAGDGEVCLTVNPYYSYANHGTQVDDGSYRTVSICSMIKKCYPDDREALVSNMIGWFGFSIPGGSPAGWPDICPSANVLPVPGNGAGFGWGVDTGGGGGPGPGGIHAEICIIDAKGTRPSDIPDWDAALDGLGYAEGTGADTWTQMLSTSLTSGSQLYDYDLVIWAGSTNYSSPGGLNEGVSKLQDYLNNGGNDNGPNLIILEDEACYDLWYSQPTFLSDYMGIDPFGGYSDSGSRNATLATGVSGTCFDGNTFGWGLYYTSFPDSFGAVTSIGEINLTCSPYSSYPNLGAQVDTGDFRTITVNGTITKCDPGDRETLASDMITWMGFELP